MCAWILLCGGWGTVPTWDKWLEQHFFFAEPSLFFFISNYNSLLFLQLSHWGNFHLFGNVKWILKPLPFNYNCYSPSSFTIFRVIYISTHIGMKSFGLYSFRQLFCCRLYSLYWVNVCLCTFRPMSIANQNNNNNQMPTIKVDRICLLNAVGQLCAE